MMMPSGVQLGHEMCSDSFFSETSDPTKIVIKLEGHEETFVVNRQTAIDNSLYFRTVMSGDGPNCSEEQIVEQSTEDKQHNIKPFLQFLLSASLIAFSLLSITATGAVMTFLNQINKPVPVGYTVWLVIGIAVLVLSIAGLGQCSTLSAETSSRFSWFPLRSEERKAATKCCLSHSIWCTRQVFSH